MKLIQLEVVRSQWLVCVFLNILRPHSALRGILLPDLHNSVSCVCLDLPSAGDESVYSSFLLHRLFSLLRPILIKGPEQTVQATLYDLFDYQVRLKDGQYVFKLLPV